MFDKLDELLNRKAQRFICRNGWPEPSPPEYSVAIGHEVGPPLGDGEIRALESQVGHVPELLALYSRCSHVLLYRQLHADTAAFYIAPPDEWGDLKESVYDWVEQLDSNEKAEILPDWFSSFVVVGRVPRGAVFYLVPLAGNHVGYVYEFDHDGYEFLPSGTSFANFINRICTVTPSLLTEISAHTRYQDERPNSQWLVDRYEFDTQSVL